jgi:hypothetical protein
MQQSAVVLPQMEMERSVLSLTLSFTEEIGVSFCLSEGELMKRAKLIILFLVGLTTAVIAQTSSTLPTQTSDLEMRAIVNLRKLEMAESTAAQVKAVFAVNRPPQGEDECSKINFAMGHCKIDRGCEFRPKKGSQAPRCPPCLPAIRKRSSSG